MAFFVPVPLRPTLSTQHLAGAAPATALCALRWLERGLVPAPQARLSPRRRLCHPPSARTGWLVSRVPVWPSGCGEHPGLVGVSVAGWEAACGGSGVGGWEGAARGAERAGWMSAHFGPLLSEVALAVDVKEEVSWQKEKIERVVQFPPINNPGGHGYLLVGGSACSPAGSWESSPSVGVVISEAPLPPPHEGASWPPGRGQSGPLSPGEHQRQRLGPFGEAGRQHGRMGSLPWLGTWAVNSGGACSPLGMKRLHWEGAGPLGALWPCPPVSCRAQTELGQPRVWQNASSRWALVVLFREPGERSPDPRPGARLSSPELTATPIVT